MKGIRKSRVKFMIILFKTSLSLMWRVNFSQLSRYSSLNEKTCLRNCRRSFDFIHFNSLSIERVYNQKNDYFLAIDASFIQKSGKATYGPGNFWNGIQSRSMKGLEISTIALVDGTYNTAYTLSVKQMPPLLEDSEENAIDLSKFSSPIIDEQIRLYGGIVYSVSLKREIRLVYVVYADTEGKKSSVMLLSTDVTLDARAIYRYDTARFQIEFMLRDVKQFTGLTHCQARTREILDFHFNVSLSLLNPARSEYQMKYPTDNECFSMASLKRSYTNEMLLNLFLSKLELDTNNEKIQSVYQELRNYGTIAA